MLGEGGYAIGYRVHCSLVKEISDGIDHDKENKICNPT